MPQLGFHIAYNAEEVIECYCRAKDKYGPLLIQEFTPQNRLQYKAELYIDCEGGLRGACVFSKVRWHPISGGYSTVDWPDMIETCEKLLKAINWRG